MATLGLDIGGANLKAAIVDGAAVSFPFDLWREPDQLSQRLAELSQRFPSFDELAVTMTGELADCFTNKRQGVEHIVRACQGVVGNRLLRIWHTSGGFVTPEEAVREPLGVAAANWHALATWAGRLIPGGSALLLDIGSTTSDIIPLTNGRPTPEGLTDLGRLQAGELVYTGVRRTPLCALAQSVPFRDGSCSLAAELFATTLDLYLILERIPEDAGDLHTANGRPATRAAAADRLARMLCCDLSEVTGAELQEIACYLAEMQRQELCRAIDCVVARQSSPPQATVISGSGSFLARDVLLQHPLLSRTRVISLEEHLSPQTSAAACAFAVAVLATEKGFEG